MAHPDTRPVSLTYAPVASMWVVTLHNLFLYSDLPLLCHPPSYWLRLFSSQSLSRMNTPKFSNPVILHTYPPVVYAGVWSVDGQFPRAQKNKKRGVQFVHPMLGPKRVSYPFLSLSAGVWSLLGF